MQADDAIVIGTLDSKKQRRLLSLLPWLSISCGLIFLVAGIQAVRELGWHWYTVILHVPAGFCLGFALHFFANISVQRSFVIRNGAVFFRRGVRDKRLFSLDAVSEVLLWDPSVMAPDSPARQAHQLLCLVLTKPFDALPLSTRRRLRKYGGAIHRNVIFLAFGVCEEPPETIVGRVLDAARTAQGRQVPLRQMTPDGVEEIDASSLTSPDSHAAHGAAMRPGLQCAECGFDLRAQRPGQLCPECGHPVAKSQQGRRLEWADRRWLESFRKGAAVLALVGPIATMVVHSLTIQALASAKGIQTGPIRIDGPLQVLGVSLLPLAVGLLLLTRRERSAIGSLPAPRTRIVCRVGLFLALMSTALLAFYGAAHLLVVCILAAVSMAIGCAVDLCARAMNRVPSGSWGLLGRLTANLHYLSVILFGAVLLVKGLERVLPLLGRPVPVRAPTASVLSSAAPLREGVFVLMLAVGMLLHVGTTAAMFIKSWRSVRSALAARDEAESLDVAQGDD